MHPEGTILRSIPLFTLTEGLIQQLEESQRRRVTLSAMGALDDVETEHDAFLLFPGMGTPSYLTRDGRILWQVSLWEVRGQRADAFSAIVLGSWKTGVTSLQALLPKRTPSAEPCAACKSVGYQTHTDIRGQSMRIICGVCRGLGWTDPVLVLEESVLEPM